MQVVIITVALNPKVNASKNRVKSIQKTPASEKVCCLAKPSQYFACYHGNR